MQQRQTTEKNKTNPVKKILLLSFCVRSFAKKRNQIDSFKS